MNLISMFFFFYLCIGCANTAQPREPITNSRAPGSKVRQQDKDDSSKREIDDDDERSSEDDEVDDDERSSEDDEADDDDEVDDDDSGKDDDDSDKDDDDNDKDDDDKEENNDKDDNSGASELGDLGNGLELCTMADTKKKFEKFGEIKRIEGFEFPSGWGILEGPIWYKGKLYFSEMTKPKVETDAYDSRILSYSEGQGIKVHSEGTDDHAHTNGIAIDSDGNIVSTVHKPIGGIVRFGDGKIGDFKAASVLVDKYDNKRFNSPNDLVIHKKGTIYFTDPGYQAPKINGMEPQEAQRAYLLDGNMKISVIEDTPPTPNGIALSPDQKSLYIAGKGPMKVYQLDENGNIEGKGKVFGDGAEGVDGMAIDCAGNIYFANAKSIFVLNSEGKQIAELLFPVEKGVTNVAFGGEDGKTMFVTAMGSGNQRGLYTVSAPIRGSVY